MCGKAVETTCNINTFGPVMLMNIQCSGNSRRFAKEMRSLKIRPAIGSLQQATERIIEADPLSTT